MPELSAIEADISATKVKLASAEHAGDKELILMYGKLLTELIRSNSGRIWRSISFILMPYDPLRIMIYCVESYV